MSNLAIFYLNKYRDFNNQEFSKDYSRILDVDNQLTLSLDDP